jgi:DNA-binding NarL/FixJ family response regulator
MTGAALATTGALATTRALRVMVVDDHDVVQWGFRLMLGSQSWVQRCLSARSGQEAYDLASRYKPDVAVIDLFVGSESGPEICERLLDRAPGTRVLLISGASRISAEAARAAGAHGFIPKDLPAGDVARAVRMVALGMSVFQPADDNDEADLSAREREVLALIAAGSTNRQIATALHLSPHTVKGHTSSLYRKLDAKNRAEAVQRAHRLGL